MTGKVVDFESRKQFHAEKRKEVRIEALRRAFRQARGETEVDPPGKRKKRSRKKK
jgi:hypothetical protein